MLKEAPFVNGKYRKGYLVCQEMVRKKVKGLDLKGSLSISNLVEKPLRLV